MLLKSRPARGVQSLRGLVEDLRLRDFFVAAGLAAAAPAAFVAVTVWAAPPEGAASRMVGLGEAMVGT